MSPDLAKYLGEVQTKAVLLEALLAALNACIDQPGRTDLAVDLVERALPLAGEINNDLDSNSLPTISGEA